MLQTAGDMSVQYPHKLQYITSGDPYQDADGNWVNPSESTDWLNATSLETDCRDQPNDKGVKMTVVDGEVLEFGSVVYCELDVPDLSRGDRVRINHGSKVRLEGTVKRFSRDEFHCRIWV
ncbi:hypothetical protein [Parapedobacter soli]|uniref:hypothetical protein n=1 Tax=Parapedobacter soli TaxID=416955 RepID=UPI0021CAC11E|nr:hypothetical protein [Parapedobacter soli]